jgi:hypothetical protein
MSNKKSRTSPELLKAVWKDYVENKMDKAEIRHWNILIEAPCPICGKKMSKTQFVEEQPKAEFAWKIVHLDQDNRNNELANLQVMHARCNLNA